MKKRTGFKMELIKKIVVTILTLSIVITSSGRVLGMEANTAQYDVNDAGATISRMFEAVNMQDWNTFTNLMCREEKSFFQYYFSDDQLTDGVKQVTDAELVNTYEVDNSLAKDEWLPGWKTEALKAGAYCVKMFGIYFALKPKNSAAGYNLTQINQNYQPDKATYASTSNAIDSIKNKGMADYAGRLFCPRYELGSSGSLGTKASGHLKQWGSQQLASQGYTHQQILNYYYSGSDYSSGNLNFFSYNMGY